MLAILQKIFRFVFGEYNVFQIYAIDLTKLEPRDDFDTSLGPIDQDRTNVQGYAGPDSHGFQYLDNDQQTSLCRCWMWYGERYKTRNFWPLHDGEAKLVRVETAEQARGKGLAPKVIEYSTSEMKKMGFKRLYARIWHSYTPSLRAFQKAGWHLHAYVIELFPFGKKLRLALPVRLTR